MNFKSILYLREAALTDTEVLLPRNGVFLVIMIARQKAYRPECCFGIIFIRCHKVPGYLYNQ